MLNMGYVDEVLLGKEIFERVPELVAEWLALAGTSQGRGGGRSGKSRMSQTIA